MTMQEKRQVILEKYENFDNALKNDTFKYVAEEQMQYQQWYYPTLKQELQYNFGSLKYFLYYLNEQELELII